ncbi:hypothetical protein K439DRAFT_1620532 [Ramaria rubella]|nr:hypothetical protein K439DRAFT_1620532 [Ramaria rubella]
MPPDRFIFPRKKVATIGHSMFPEGIIIFPLRRTSNNPVLHRQVENFMGMEHQELITKVDGFMLRQNARNNLNTFRTIREGGPFKRINSQVIYLPEHDKNKERRKIYPSTEKDRWRQTLAQHENHDADVTGHRTSNVKQHSRLRPICPAVQVQPLKLGCSLSYNDPDFGDELVKLSCATQTLYDMLAYAIADSSKRECSLQYLIRRVLPYTSLTKDEITHALYSGPFHVTPGLRVTYEPYLDKYSSTRPGEFAARRVASKGRCSDR